ncbi:MAG: hypothetical protein H7099_09720 [Gemmatimonadaceae bacterium]|nr:hypothetical protein [Gemmatimonadaceae bacterium]
MSDTVLFVLVFGGLFVLRGVAATIVFLWILPDGVRCPQCDAETTRVESGGVLRWLPQFRSSWCLVCGWHGVHRIVKTPVSSAPSRADTSASAATPGRRR